MRYKYAELKRIATSNSQKLYNFIEIVKKRKSDTKINVEQCDCKKEKLISFNLLAHGVRSNKIVIIQLFDPKFNREI